MTAIHDLKQKLKKANDECYTWYNFRNCHTCKHCVTYLYEGQITGMLCLKKHDIPKKGLRKCEDYERVNEGVKI